MEMAEGQSRMKMADEYGTPCRKANYQKGIKDILMPLLAIDDI